MLKQVQQDKQAGQSAPDSAVVAKFERDLAALGVATDTPLAIAVSGGGDSLALLLLAHEARPGRVQAATVDHRLRPESAAEAAMVADVCHALGVPHATLAADAPPSGNLQSSARTIRYRLLADWAADAGLPVLATAHQLDDQVETLLMRLARGSGVAGLAGIRARRALHPDTAGSAVLIRPLLNWRRAELAAIAAAAGLTPVRDPSNENPRFDRARLRSELADADWLDAVAIARSAAALAEAEAALDWSVGQLAPTRLTLHGDAHRLDPHTLPFELLRRLVARAISEINPGAAPFRAGALDRLIASLEAGRPAMLGDVVATPGASWTFAPAPPRRAP